MRLPGGSEGKACVYNERHLGSIPGLGRFPGEGNGNPLQYSCLENPMDNWKSFHFASLPLRNAASFPGVTATEYQFSSVTQS